MTNKNLRQTLITLIELQNAMMVEVRLLEDNKQNFEEAYLAIKNIIESLGRMPDTDKINLNKMYENYNKYLSEIPRLLHKTPKIKHSEVLVREKFRQLYFLANTINKDFNNVLQSLED